MVVRPPAARDCGGGCQASPALQGRPPTAGQQGVPTASHAVLPPGFVDGRGCSCVACRSAGCWHGCGGRGRAEPAAGSRRARASAAAKKGPTRRDSAQQADVLGCVRHRRLKARGMHVLGRPRAPSSPAASQPARAGGGSHGGGGGGGHACASACICQTLMADCILRPSTHLLASCTPRRPFTSRTPSSQRRPCCRKARARAPASCCAPGGAALRRWHCWLLPWRWAAGPG